MAKYVYFFGAGAAEGNMKMKDILGGKGANLAEMAGIGLPVPPGFTISTEVCALYYKNRQRIPESLRVEVEKNLKKLEKSVGQAFGDLKNPLLVSVRSGARASMPGMMDTILNLGLTDRTAAALAAKTGNERFVYDSYRRFVQMYGDVVLGLKPVHKDDIDPFEAIIEAKKRERGVRSDTELTAADLKDLVARFKAAIKDKTGQDFPEDPKKQLWGAIGAVFGSWMNERAIAYRKMYDIPEAWGTAVNVQLMVFGNMGADSGTGVAFTRDAASGENVFYGEYLMNAQGEDVVAGIRTPKPISELKNDDPKAYAQLEKIRRTLEKHYADMMDVEFTIQQGKLYMLQCRVGKRTAFAAIRIAVDMVGEKLISEKEALSRIEPDQLNQLLRPIFDPAEKAAAVKSGKLLTKGLNAGPGAATGRVVFNSVDAEAWAKRGEKVVLTRIETSPEDIKGMNAAEGILTARGGMTSHAALVARQMGRVCVAGCGDLVIDYGTRAMTVKGRTIKEGDWISIDGTTGEVLEGKLQTKPSEVLQVLIEKTLDPSKAPVYQTFAKVMAWADKYRTLKIRTNADQPDQSANAVAFGAEGIGLCRTEHMFFGAGKIGPMREMILADTVEQRKAALAKLLPLQRQDFAGIFEVMAGRPVTIRTIDPPLHEFLPHEEKEQREVAAQMGIPYEKVKERVDSLHEFNPMLGFRGCRLGIIYPEITEMQARAIFEAAAATKKKGLPVLPEVMIPLVGHVKELRNQEKLVRATAEAVMKEQGVKFDYLVGTMIEIPRGAVTADEIASVAEFFSFGTNDLTQTTLGVSRDDAARFLRPYVDMEIYAKDPFEVLDRDGVGQLMRIAAAKGRSTRPGIKLGICGEHGGEPSSVEFCHLIGLNYVSCSPFRVPIARLAAARAAILNAPKTAAKPVKKAAKAKKPAGRR
ncbi:MAG TPA: pyruvate, phosphate dikinase [Candidatus Aminicenantes bacterium]|nr:pyruvate, phosphate dikinase [Candidatus Aminicenantes bacterium]HRY63763.1 pyruvate, phosphate dikinase [Candidatus Aminicenantes bacterium]HRZ70676.1 pyruvate, phosphate dikinase [Candidatus Aminicenantes bacterium]